MYTLWRKLLYKELEKVKLTGSVLDVGGSSGAKYHDFFKKDCNLKAINLETNSSSDINFDIEQGSWPIETGFYDNIICLNVLEHIFDYKFVLKEMYRVLKKEGKIVLAVPFLLQIHPCPHDYWRFSAETLEKIFKQNGFTNIDIKAIGYGPFSASCQLKFNVYKINLVRKIAIKFNIILDKILFLLKKQTMTTDNYPLGFVVEAQK